MVTRADIVVEMSDVLYTANTTLLCMAVVGNLTTGVAIDICSVPENCDAQVECTTLERLVIKGVMRTGFDQYTFPVVLNQVLTTDGFFPNGVGQVTIVTNKIQFIALFICVMLTAFFVFLAVACCMRDRIMD